MPAALGSIQAALGWGAVGAYLVSKFLHGDAKLLIGGAAFVFLIGWLLIALVQLPGAFVGCYREIVDHFSAESRAAREAERNMAKVRALFQEGADSNALSIARQEVDQPFSLLLRPFRSDGNATPVCDWLKENECVKITSSEHGVTLRGYVYRWQTLEGALAATVSEIAPLIAIEPPGHHKWFRAAEGRPGQFTPDSEDWKSTVEHQMQHASFIFVIPGHHPGIAWEIGRIFGSTELLRKTFFVLQPLSDENSLKHWDQVRHTMVGLPLPDASDHLQLASASNSSDGAAPWDYCAPFEDRSLRNLNRLLRRLAALTLQPADEAPRASLHTRSAPDPLEILNRFTAEESPPPPADVSKYPSPPSAGQRAGDA